MQLAEGLDDGLLRDMLLRSAQELLECFSEEVLLLVFVQHRQNTVLEERNHIFNTAT